MADSGVGHGFVFQGARYEGGVVNAREYTWSAGGDLVDDPTNPKRMVVDSPDAITTAQTRPRKAPLLSADASSNEKA
jgi:hypothetical protein